MCHLSVGVPVINTEPQASVLFTDQNKGGGGAMDSLMDRSNHDSSCLISFFFLSQGHSTNGLSYKCCCINLVPNHVDVPQVIYHSFHCKDLLPQISEPLLFLGLGHFNPILEASNIFLQLNLSSGLVAAPLLPVYIQAVPIASPDAYGKIAVP